MIIKFKKIINFIQPPSLKRSYKKYIKPLKEVKQAQNPLKKRVLMDWLNFLDIIKPKTNEPIIEVKILLFINSRVTDAKNATNIINKEFLIFIYKQFL